jgi:NADPH2:quinone reductase
VLGARVIACASPSKLDVARTAGADFVVDYTKEGWQKEILKITGERGVDLVYDPVGRIKGICHASLESKPQLISPLKMR